MRMSDRVPAGYFGVPLGEAVAPALRPCLVAREEPDPVGGRFVALESVLDSTAWLGCVLDASDRVVLWLRVVVQDVDRVSDAASGGVGLWSNGALEARWRRNVAALDAAVPGEAVWLGWETAPAPVLMYDPRKRALSRVMHEASGTFFDVCRDDRVLLGRGLPAFSAGLHRYLWVESLGAASPFVAVTGGAPDSGAVLADVLTGVNRGFEPVNPRGGMVMARRLHPMRLDRLVDVLGGGPWSGVAHGTSVLLLDRGEVTRAGEIGRASAESIDPDRLYLGRHGRWGRLVETLHLKLRLLSEAARQVREVVTRTGRPLFNLSAESFEADMHDPVAGLPRLWTLSLKLIDAGTAVDLDLPAGRTRHVMAPEGLGRGVYKPLLRARATAGQGALRVRGSSVDGGQLTLEATLRSQERLSAGTSDLLMLRLLVAGERVVLYARLTDEAGLAGGEIRLRTLAQEVPAGVAAGLRASEGVPIEGVGFEVLPMVSTPCDLYALGVLAVRMLLTDGEQALPVALDEAQSLARRVAEVPGSTVEERVERVFMADPRWTELLGPHRLVRERVDAQESMDLVPPDLWFSVLGVVLRMFPGEGMEPYTRDLGDAPAGAPQRVFDGPIDALDGLLVRTRSLVVIDWRQNREVHGVLRDFREGQARVEGPVIPRLS